MKFPIYFNNFFISDYNNLIDLMSLEKYVQRQSFSFNMLVFHIFHLIFALDGKFIFIYISSCFGSCLLKLLIYVRYKILKFSSQLHFHSQELFTNYLINDYSAHQRILLYRGFQNTLSKIYYKRFFYLFILEIYYSFLYDQVYKYIRFTVISIIIIL